MFKTAAVIGFTAATPAHADGVFSKSSLRIGDINLSINNSGTVLTKTDASTGKWLGEQKFSEFKGMMWVPEGNVLFVSGFLPNSSTTVLVKIRGTGGGGQNMFALEPSGRSVKGYNYRLGSQNMLVESMSYDGILELYDGVNDDGLGKRHRIRGLGGTGDNMFALLRGQGSFDDACQSLDGYDYFIECLTIIP